MSFENRQQLHDSSSRTSQFWELSKGQVPDWMDFWIINARVRGPWLFQFRISDCFQVILEPHHVVFERGQGEGTACENKESNVG